MHRPLVAVLLLAALGGAACKSDSTTATTPTTPSTGTPTVLTFSTSGNLAVNIGDSHQVKAVALLSDGTTQILTNGATWSSSNPVIATVTDSGIVTGVSAGTASVAIGVGAVSGSVTVIVADAAATSQSFTGTLSGANTVTGSLDVSVPLSTSRASGTLYIVHNAVSLVGRLDAAASVLNVSGGAYSILGTVASGVATGTYTDATGITGGFTAIDSTHTAVTTYCGAYTGSDGSAGAFTMVVSASGAAAGSGLQSDGGLPPAVFSGRADGGTIAMRSSSGLTASGTVLAGVANGTFQASSAVTGAFSANSSACR